MTTTTKTLSAETFVRTPESLWQQALHAFLRQRAAVIGLVIIATLALIAIFAPLIAPYDPEEVLIGVENIQKREPPCIHILGCSADRPQHIMGIDGNVRDEWSRI